VDDLGVGRRGCDPSSDGFAATFSREGRREQADSSNLAIWG
jgi:hypothetical protein